MSFALALAVLAPPSALAMSSPFAVDNPFISDGLKAAADDRDRDNTPAAAAEREQSRHRYADLSASESLALGRRIFPEAFAIDLFDGENPAPGLQIVDYTSRTTAIAKGEDGERLLVQSTAPLRAETPNGQMAPVDLALREGTDTFTTTNSNADIQISKNVEDGASLPAKDVTIKPVVARNADGQKTDGRVYFPRVDVDTDYLVAPEPHGGEVGWLLRSADSPERFLLDVDMPEGASIRRPQPEKPIPGDPPRGLEIIKDGKLLIAITAPIAYDANHAPVKTELSIVGDQRIAMSVEHRGKDLAYPLYADPEVMILANNPNWWYGWGPAWYTHGGYYNSTTNYYGVALLDPSYNPNGIYLSMPTNQTYWPRNTGVNWSYKAPVDSYIYRAIMGHVGLNGLEGTTHKWYSWGYRFAYLYSGLMDPTRSNWDAGQDWVARLNGTQYAAAGGIFGPNPDARAGWDFDHCYSRCNNLAGSDQNEAILGLSAINNYNSNNILTGDAKASATMNYAQIYLGDRFAPSMRWDAAPASRDWRDDSASPTQTITPTALDRGLGVKSITLSGATTGDGDVSSSCTGHPQLSPCQKEWTAYAGFRYTLNEGINAMSLTPRDIIGNAGEAANWTENIDRTKPRVVSMSGTLYDDRVETHPKGMGLYRPTEHLDVQVADDHSGITSARLLVDGQPIHSVPTVTADCTSGCPKTFSASFDLDPMALAPGDHVITVAVNDRVDSHTATSSPINVYVPDDNPIRIDENDDGEPSDFADIDDNSTCPSDPDYPNDPEYCSQDEADPLTEALRNEPGVDETTASQLRMGNLAPTASSTASSQTALQAGEPCNLRAPISGPELTDNTGRYGLSDQNAYGGSSIFGEDTFADPNAQALQVKHLRLVPEYDLVPLARGSQNGSEFCTRYQKVYFWIARAQARSQDVLISFDRSRTKEGNVRTNNTINEYRAAVTEFLDRFPTVKLYTAFNEPNLPGDRGPALTRNNPGTAGKMWVALNALCRVRGCKVGAGDFSDVLTADKQNGLTSSYLNAYYEGMGRKKPVFWAIHGYQTVFRSKYGRLQRFLDWSPVQRTGAVWMTETGVYRYTAGGTSFAESVGASRLQNFFDSSVYKSNLPKIKRFYYYQWHGLGPNTDDYGLVAPSPIPGGAKREVYCVFFKKLRPGVTCST